MAKKPMMTREELLAQLETLDNSTEIGKLTADVSRLTEENTALLSQRGELERDLKRERDALQSIREILGKVDVGNRTFGADSPGMAELQAASARASRFGIAEVLVGVQEGTHDPLTGLRYTDETKPQRSLIAGAPKVTQTELEAFFPALSGPEVDVTTTAAAMLDAKLSEHRSALGIASGN